MVVDWRRLKQLAAAALIPLEIKPRILLGEEKNGMKSNYLLTCSVDTCLIYLSEEISCWPC